MRRIYLLVLAVVLVATLVGLAISEQAGYVLIAYKSFRYESSPACAISAKATGRRHCVTCGGRRRWASGR